jgi:hypothetical membrane protein
MNGSINFLRVAAWSGIVAPLLFAFLVGVESVLRPGYSQIANNVSDLGIGPYSIIQNANFILFGALAIIFAFGLGAVLPHGSKSSGRAKWVAVLFGLGIMFAGITLLFAGSTADSSAVGSHVLASFVAFFAAIGMQLLVWRALRAEDRALWGRYRTYSLVSGVVSLAMLIVFSYLSNMPYHGFTERLFIAVPWVWIEVSGFKIRSLSKVHAVT